MKRVAIRHRLPEPIVVAALLFPIVLGGCYSPLASVEGVIQLSRLACPTHIVANCAESASPAFAYHLRPEAIGGNLTIARADAGVILDGFRISGGPLGLAFHNVVCGACTIRVANGTISGITRVALMASHVSASVQLENLTIEVDGGGHIRHKETTLPSGKPVLAKILEGGTAGIKLFNVSGSVDARSLRLTSRLPNVQTAMEHWVDNPSQAGSRVAFHDFNVSGFATGIHYRGLAGAEVRNVSVACGETAMDIFSEGTVRITNVTAAACAREALRVLARGMVDLRGVQVRDSSIGASVSAEAGWSGRALLLERNGEAFRGGGPPAVPCKLEDSAFRGNLLVGLNVTGCHFMGLGLLFEKNGPGNASFAERRGGFVIHAIPPTEATHSLRNSRFVGNHPYGLISTDPSPFDARENWWNSPSGPRVVVLSSRGHVPLPGEGDAVNQMVIYSPWRTQP